MAKLMAVGGLLVILMLGAACGSGSQSVAVSTTTRSTGISPDPNCLEAVRAFADDERVTSVAGMVERCRSLEEMELAIARFLSIPREDIVVREASEVVTLACTRYRYQGPVCESLPK
jgi:hypothetical protein